MRERLGGLKARLALVMGLFLLAPAAYAIVQAVRVYEGQTTRSIDTLRQTAGLIAAYETKEVLPQARGVLDQLSARPDLLLGDPAACSAALEDAAAHNGRFAVLLVADAAGRVRCGSAAAPVGGDVSRRDWFRQVVGEGGQTSGDRPRPSPRGLEATPGQAVALAAPLRRGDAFAGALAAYLDPARFTADAANVELPEGAVAYLVNRQRGVVTAADRATVTLPPAEDIAGLLDDPGGTVVEDGPGGRMVFLATPIEPEHLYALVGLPSPSWSWLQQELLLGVILPVLMLAIAVIGIWIATDFLVNRHIHDLARATRAYAAGRLAAWPPLDAAPTELRELAAVLARIAEDLGAREAELKASLAQKEVLIREIHHRVKNNLQVVTSLLNLRAQSAASPAARLAMIEAQSRVKALALVHRDLYEGDDEVRTVELQPLLAELSNLLEDVVPGGTGGIDVRLDLAPVRVSVDRAVPVALFAAEALSNAFKHAFPPAPGEGDAVADAGRGGGTVSVSLAREGEDQARLTVEDDGVGLGADERPPAGLGMTLMRMLAGQAGGRLAIGPGAGGRGSRVELAFPLLPRRKVGAAPEKNRAGDAEPPAPSAVS